MEMLVKSIHLFQIQLKKDEMLRKELELVRR